MLTFHLAGYEEGFHRQVTRLTATYSQVLLAYNAPSWRTKERAGLADPRLAQRVRKLQLLGLALTRDSTKKTELRIRPAASGNEA